MKDFFDDNLLLNSKAAVDVYNAVKDLPIIDYHCHLDQNKIAEDTNFSDIGEMWLSGDHYKWRAMRLCGVDEYYITGKASYKEKFIKYAEIMPKLLGNPLYYWTHLELKQIFNINEPLNFDSAERIYLTANEKIKGLSVQKLLKQFKVEYIATTDDPIDILEKHGKYAGTTVAPTFRPDKLFTWNDEYIYKLGNGIDCLDKLLKAYENKLDFFVSKGCRIADHGYDKFPADYATYEEAEKLFLKRNELSTTEKDALFGFFLIWFAKEYKKRNIVMQLHFSVVRNVNSSIFKQIGADTGFDVMSNTVNTNDVISFLNQLNDDERPKIILYTLNPSELKSLATLSGAFRNMHIGAAWWFNDTAEGIKHNLSVVSEYAVLGTNLGMLTDSRSFSSYSRFDFFRRILSDFIGEKVEKGEYDINSAKTLAKNICYKNIKELLK